jgi:hypothetical protein
MSKNKTTAKATTQHAKYDPKLPTVNPVGRQTLKPKADEPKPRKLKYDPARILALWEKGKSIREIAEAMKPISRVFVHRVLTLKFPKQYAKGKNSAARDVNSSVRRQK